MFIVYYIAIVFITVVNCDQSIDVLDQDGVFTVNITMKDFETTKEDQYMYIQYKIPDEELFIIGFLPLTNLTIAHHVVTFACSTPYSNESFWIGNKPCNGPTVILHDWSYNIPTLALLPKDVGIAVGRNTPNKYIVVNVHYLLILKGDNSGLQLVMTRKPCKYHANTLLSGSSDIKLQPNTETIQVPFSCSYRGQLVSFFAAAVHTHMWGRVNSLYRVRNGNVTLIVKNSPKISQAFNLLSSPVDIQSGDYLIGQCVYDNNDDRVIVVGDTHNDEMCNIYVMYSYIPENITSNQQTIYRPPFPTCWNNLAPNMTKLLPEDSVIFPPISDEDQTDVDESTSSPTTTVEVLKSSTIKNIDNFTSADIPKQTITKQFSFHHDTLVIVWTSLIIILILFVILCYILYIRNRRQVTRFNVYAINVDNSDTSNDSMFNNWTNRQNKFKRLEFDIDEENPSSY
ncbi:unnamed protein product [Adineta steineri]|uniref:peptidylglycine monooxygenase n=2 Tax=Adineta steineri TaxID=433720 RepID=A0A819FLZ7_9BILA|nr:unnamed protein product [Adineta steineri]CAF3870367.1 unnamed protein product [Adineta steineri]